MILWSWNVNGLRAVMKKGFADVLRDESPDILCLQETKLQEEQIPPELRSPDSYGVYWHHAQRKGYSSVALFSKPQPQTVSRSIGEERFDSEGRVLRADYDGFILYGVYFPNGQRDAGRLQYKLDFYDRMFELMQADVAAGRDVVLCGDVNTAHKPIDLTHPRSNEKTSGFLPIERAWLDKLFDNGWIDTLRHFDDRPQQYSWWSYISQARQRNVGWRLDYFIVNRGLLPRLKRAFIRPDIFGSDHCPVGIELEI
ncbi:MAG: exodeoxyribonuclease III [Candidatus Cloacimonetes bacterium]|nr:exodeoxyribonuclease III [Candidatus Cloacimonadota bacterium]